MAIGRYGRVNIGMVSRKRNLTIVKYGSGTLVTQDAAGDICIDHKVIAQHGSIINRIKNPVIIVSSGAVAFGKSLKPNLEHITNETVKKRVYSALGNPQLSIEWDKVITDKVVLQSLLTHRDLSMDSSRGKIIEIIDSIFGVDTQPLVIQVNDNDFITDEELVVLRNGDFGDNDEITKLLAVLSKEIFEEIEVVINTSSDGVLQDGEVVSELHADQLTDMYIDTICGSDKTSVGTGGMSNKLKNVRDLIYKVPSAKVYIVNGKKPNQLNSLLKGEDVGTKVTE